MRGLLFALAAGSALILGVPSDVYAGSGVGVRVGPDGIRIGPRERGHYARDCRVVKERIVRPNGNVTVKTRRVCD
jgi:hypothetical protein